jgi:hypothetical protein
MKRIAITLYNTLAISKCHFEKNQKNEILVSQKFTALDSQPKTDCDRDLTT